MPGWIRQDSRGVQGRGASGRGGAGFARGLLAFNEDFFVSPLSVVVVVEGVGG